MDKLVILLMLVNIFLKWFHGFPSLLKLELVYGHGISVHTTLHLEAGASSSPARSTMDVDIGSEVNFWPFALCLGVNEKWMLAIVWFASKKMWRLWDCMFEHVMNLSSRKIFKFCVSFHEYLEEVSSMFKRYIFCTWGWYLEVERVWTGQYVMCRGKGFVKKN